VKLRSGLMLGVDPESTSSGVLFSVKEMKCGFTQSMHASMPVVGEIKSLNSNSNLKSNLDKTCFENSNLKMYAHNDENTNCVFGKRTHVDHNF